MGGSLVLGKTGRIRYNPKKDDSKGIFGKKVIHVASIEIKTGTMNGKPDICERIRVSDAPSDNTFAQHLLATYDLLGAGNTGVAGFSGTFSGPNAKAHATTLREKLPDTFYSRRRRRMAQRQFSSRRDSPVNRRRRRRLNNRGSPDSERPRTTVCSKKSGA